MPRDLTKDESDRIGKAMMASSDLVVCEWSRIDSDFNHWRSSCGEEWCLEDGGPKENNMRFCHGCGKPLRENSQSDDLG